MAANADTLLRLVQLLYSAAEDDHGWEPFLTALADSVGGQAATLLSHDLTGAGGVAAAARFNPETARQYDRYFHRLDPYARSLSQRPAAARVGVYASDMLVPRDNLVRSEFFNDFAVPGDIQRMVTAIMLTAGDRLNGSASGVTIVRRGRDREFERADLELIRQLHPHLARALEVRHKLRTADQTQQTLDAVFDLLPAPAIVVDRTGIVLRANPRAEKILSSRAGLHVRDRRLSAPMSAETTRLRAACAAAATDHSLPGATVRVAELRIVVIPLAAESPVADSTGGRALVLIDDPDQVPAAGPALLGRLYGLTKTEAEIAARIGSGESLETIANGRAVSLQTVQWHNKRILAKLDCRSRGELVRRLNSGVARLVRS
jgi:DNA-binding CsgD family transcriptional regulator